jgi:hypothetical protein
MMKGLDELQLKQRIGHLSLRVVLGGVGAILFAAIVSTWVGVILFASIVGTRRVVPPCPLPNGVSATSRLNDAPASLARALTERVGEVVPAGARFDATDVVVTGKNRRLIFIWNLGNRWVVATEHGGVGYNNPIFAFDISEDGLRATFVQESTTFPDSVCLVASSLLASWHQTVPPKDVTR